MRRLPAPRPFRRLLGVTVLALLVLAATVPAAAQGSDRTLTIWMFLAETSPAGQSMVELGKRFEEANPGVRVEILWGYDMNKIIASVIGGQSADIVQVQGDWVNSLALQGLLSPVDEMAERAGLSFDAYFPPLLTQLELGGRLYGLPYTVNPHFVIFWNKALLNEIGVDAERGPEWFEDIRALHDRITSFGPDGRLQRVGMHPWDAGHFANAQFYWSGFFGSRFYDPATGIFHLNDAGGVEALEWLLGFLDQYTYAESWQQPFIPRSTAIAHGQLGMSLAVPEWFAGAIRDFPDVEFGVRVVPDRRDGGPRGDFLAGAVLGIPSTAQEFNPLAWEFLRFATASDEGSRLLSGNGLFPPYRESSVLIEWSLDPVMAPFVELAQRATRGRPPVEDTNFVTQALNQAVRSVLDKQQTPVAALDEANRVVQSYFDGLRSR